MPNVTVPFARYIVRAVATELSTTVAWSTANGATVGSQLVTRGNFVQITNPLASQPMRVDCDKPCLVMLYNTGTFDSSVVISNTRSSAVAERSRDASCH